MVKIVKGDYPAGWHGFFTGQFTELDPINHREKLPIPQNFFNHEITTFYTSVPDVPLTLYDIKGEHILITDSAMSGTITRVELDYNFVEAITISDLNVPLGQFPTDIKQLLKGDDQIRGNDASEYIRGFDGNDDIDGRGGSDRIYGDDGNDDLHGENGTDFLYGGDGDDTLRGGNAHDVFEGGKGKDTFFFVKAGGVTDRIDIIVDFVKADSIALNGDYFKGLEPDAKGHIDSSHFASLGKASFNSGPLVLFDKSSGRLYYDADGTGPANEKLVATLVGLVDLTSHDILVV